MLPLPKLYSSLPSKRDRTNRPLRMIFTNINHADSVTQQEEQRSQPTPGQLLVILAMNPSTMLKIVKSLFAIVFKFQTLNHIRLLILERGAHPEE
jgi:hypothetical protein